MQKEHNSHFKILATQHSKCQLGPERIKKGVIDSLFAPDLKTFSGELCSILGKAIICQIACMGYVSSNCRATAGDERKNT